VLHFGTLLPLAVLGLWATRRDGRRLWPLHALALALAASVVLFYVMGRYRYPLVPVLAIFAGAGVEDLLGRFRARSPAALGRAALLLAAVALPCNWPLRGQVDPRTITWYGLGLELVESGRYEEGRQELERALALDPAFADAHVTLGTALLAEDDARGALVHFDEAMRLDPRHAGARTGAAMVQLERGDARGAEARLREALALDPLLVEAHNNLAVALARQDRPEEALDALRAALRLRPEDTTSRLNLARLLLAVGRPDEARAEVERVLAVDPQNAAARRLQGGAENGDGAGGRDRGRDVGSQ
jgi:Tfp pilus assembly protein PilF